MVDTYGIKRLKTIEDWVEVVSARHYKKGHSAYETCHKYKSVGSRLPEPVYSILKQSGIKYLQDIEIQQIYAEYPVFLDTLKTPSKNDLMIFARSSTRSKIVIAVEAKCLEEFGPRVNTWLRGPDPTGTRYQRKLFRNPEAIIPRKKQRLEFLNEVLSQEIGPDSSLRYQLLHRSASAILTARQTFAQVALVLVHAFADSERNFDDFKVFCQAFGFENPQKNSVIGPHNTTLLGEVPIYFLYVQDKRQEGSPESPLF